MPNENESEDVPDFDTPWEFPLILALRDMQWVSQAKKFRQLFHTVTPKESRSIDNMRVFNHTLSALDSPPPALLKLSGNAETASGDVITSANARFFLFEFKATQKQLLSERGKHVYKVLDRLIKTPNSEIIQTLSRVGHHALFPFVDKRPNETWNGLLPIAQVEFLTQPYLDAVHRRMKGPQATTGGEFPDVQTLMTTKGLSLAKMAAYLKFLAESFPKGPDALPLKATIVSSNSLFYPLGDLNDFLNFAEVFGKEFAATLAVNDEYLKILEQMRKTLPDLEFRNDVTRTTFRPGGGSKG